MPKPESGFPINFYIYNEQGFYGEPIICNCHEDLTRFFKSANARKAFWSGCEIRGTDDFDFCVFHAKDKKILHSGSDYPQELLVLAFFGKGEDYET